MSLRSYLPIKRRAPNSSDLSAAKKTRADISEDTPAPSTLRGGSIIKERRCATSGPWLCVNFLSHGDCLCALVNFCPSYLYI